MKKKRAARKGKAKGKRGGAKTVDEYVSRVPEPARGMLKKMRAAVRSAAPKGATETISYGIPAIRHGKVLVWFAAFADHCSLFPTAAVIDEFKPELRRFSLSKGTVHFPLDTPLPVGLIKRMVKARVETSASS